MLSADFELYQVGFYTVKNQCLSVFSFIFLPYIFLTCGQTVVTLFSIRAIKKDYRSND
nr:MAG TPA_asm: hypothetical protein [Caudoviricetes sp.]